jgi:hypothetical protein
VCQAECLPRKELYESWEFARRVRRRLRGGNVVDLAAGHGLVALILLVLDDSSERALAVDVRVPPSAHRLKEAFERDWPRLRDRITFKQASLDQIEVTATDLVVSAHACGTLTDRVLDIALSVRANVAVLPCCQAEGKCDSGGLLGWMDSALAVDVTRAHRLRSAGYEVVTQKIPEAITPKNRLLIGLNRTRAGSADSSPTGLEHQAQIAG